MELDPFDAEELAALVRAWADKAYRTGTGPDDEHDAAFDLADAVARLLGFELDTSIDPDDEPPAEHRQLIDVTKLRYMQRVHPQTGEPIGPRIDLRPEGD